MRFANGALPVSEVATQPIFGTEYLLGGAALPQSVLIGTLGATSGISLLIRPNANSGANAAPCISEVVDANGFRVGQFLTGQFAPYARCPAPAPGEPFTVNLSSPIAGTVASGDVWIATDFELVEPPVSTETLRIDNRSGTASVTQYLLLNTNSWWLEELSIDVIAEATLEVTAQWTDAFTGGLATPEVLGVGSSTAPSVAHGEWRPRAAIAMGGVAITVPVGAMAVAVATARMVN